MIQKQKAINYVLKRIKIVEGVKTINGTVDLTWLALTELPDLSDVVVNGNFSCSNNQLTSLQGCPNTIYGHFSCHNNKLTSLKGCPKIINGSFSCSNNQLTSLEGSPNTIRGHFSCATNKLTSLKYGPAIINGNFDCSHNKITSFEGGPHTVKGNFHCEYNKLTALQHAPTHIDICFYGYKNPWRKPLKIIDSLASQEYADLLEQAKEQANIAYLKAHPVPITSIDVDI